MLRRMPIARVLECTHSILSCVPDKRFTPTADNQVCTWDDSTDSTRDSTRLDSRFIRLSLMFCLLACLHVQSYTVGGQ